jgi:hypothetical protein
MKTRQQIDQLFEVEKVDDCWMDPEGDRHPVTGQTHGEWASEYLFAEKGYYVEDGQGESTLYEMGWVRVVLERRWSGGPMTHQLYVSHGLQPLNRTQIAELELLGIEHEFEVVVDGPNDSWVLYKPPVAVAEGWSTQSGEYWIDPDGKLLKAPNGHLPLARMILSARGKDIPTDADGYTPGLFTLYDDMFDLNYGRVVISYSCGYIDVCVGKSSQKLTRAQMNALKDLAIEKQWRLMLHTQHYFEPAETIYRPGD